MKRNESFDAPQLFFIEIVANTKFFVRLYIGIVPNVILVRHPTRLRAVEGAPVRKAGQPETFQRVGRRG